MDALTTSTPEPSSSSPVSLRPGGGGRFSFKGSALSNSSGSAGLRPAGYTSPFAFRQEQSASKSREELLRYSKEDLLRYREEWTTLPEEIAGSDVQRTSTSFEDSGRPREPSFIPERVIEPDTRDWRGRTPLPAPPEQERPERPREPYRERERPVPKEGRAGLGDRQQSSSLQNRVSEQSSSYNQYNQQQLPQQQQQQQQYQGQAQGQGQGQGQGQSTTASLPAIVKSSSPWSARRVVQSDKDKCLKNVKGILNKLTPEKYGTLLEQLKQSGITSAEILQGVISLVFDKAVLEPTFCSMYSELCVDLSTALPEFPGAEAWDKPITFKRVLLNTCQSEFEGADALRAEIRQLTSPEQEQQRFEKERNVKLRTLGNIRFIGELFKQKMIPEIIVHACTQDLLGLDSKVIPAEENVEALCQLFTTVGKALDASPKSRNLLDSYFARLKDFSNKKVLPSRIRFMVRDILDARADNWVPRREEVKAKTISEVHAEAEQKLGLRAGVASLRVSRTGSPAAMGLPSSLVMMPGAPGSGRGTGMMPGMPGMPAGAQPPYGLEGDGWEMVGTGGRKSRREIGTAPVATSAFNRLPTAGSRSSSLNSRILPQGSGGAPFAFKPSALLGNSAAPSLMGQAPVPGAFRNGPSPPAPAPAPVPVPVPGHVPVPVPADLGPPRPVSSSVVPAAAAESRVELPSSATVRKKSQSMLDEYFSIVDLKEALLCLKELGGPEVHPQFVEVALGVVFDKRDREQELVSNLFNYLHTERVLSGGSIKTGFVKTAQDLEDIAMDAPLAPKLMGNLVANLLLSKAADCSLLLDVSKQIEDVELRRSILGNTFKFLLSKAGEEQTVTIFKSLSQADLGLFGDKSELIETLRGDELVVLSRNL